MADIEKGERFDIMLLDILMPGENGMTAAREVREHDTNVKIIFLTSSPEFAVESYAVSSSQNAIFSIRGFTQSLLLFISCFFYSL